jgi:hypothetical protein
MIDWRRDRDKATHRQAEARHDEKMAFFSAAALIVFAAGPGPQTASVARAAGCEAGDKIDSSTAAEARTKMESAGFHQVRDLQKGCDNFWHGIAVKDGNESHVVLTPQGQVMREGD